ncbi:NYN domain-containing protein [Bifidobacterium pseudolongum]|uniref:NYN domain-containing protein n=1 Tax=Bifidobacterium pseudolongum TaxID=1694 RepID=UPI001F0D9A9C|nr:NYN domain-containing protein [Bifidobacterium pseudolongum]MCH4842556.1 NYN domain-containing protein [Bifidobacterium pseudolongum]
MEAEEKDINIALLIDADNISAKYISAILSELSRYGKITIRRMYGDWTQERLRSWFNQAAKYSLTPIMQPNNTPGKNASDIGLIIDAMDILYEGKVQGFCIVSSDGDFNRLATRLREAGMTVIGMGEKKTPEAFRVSCERFIFLDVIESSEEDAEDTACRASQGAKKNNTTEKAETKKTKTPTQPALPELPPAPASAENDDENAGITALSDIEAAIVKMITDNSADGKETGAYIGSRLVKIFPDFDIRNYHYSKLSEFLTGFPSLQVTNRGNVVWVTLKSTPDTEVEKQIQSIFARHNTADMNTSMLKIELQNLIPNLDATIRKSGVTRFSVYLNRKIPSVEVNGQRVSLKS